MCTWPRATGYSYVTSGCMSVVSGVKRSVLETLSHRTHCIGAQCEVFAWCQCCLGRETIVCSSEAQNSFEERVKIPRREKPDPQDRLVRRIRKVGIPDLLEFRSQFCQLRRFEAQFDARVDTADAMVSKRKAKKKYWSTCALRDPSWSWQIRRWQLT
jgi:hypothetical protein